MKKPQLLIIAFICCCFAWATAQDEALIEAESFLDKGGWMTDPQFIEQMGSTYLMAHGMGKVVKNASTKIELDQPGEYYVWARTRDWAPGPWEAPGRFKIQINGQALKNTLGLNPDWNWEYAGKMKLSKGTVKLELADLTGFNGRCDAIYLSTKNQKPPQDGPELKEWRRTRLKEPIAPEVTKNYDLVVTGGGIAGCAASIAAAEQGLKVALIHDRPLLGGNASSEIRVHTLGIYGKFERILKMIDTEHYPNGSPDAIKDQEKRDRNVQKYSNIDIHYNWRAYDALSQDSTIVHVDARHTSSGERIRFKAPLFVDATGDGWIGYWAGAEYSYGRESVYKYGEAWDKWGELWSPEEADNAVMGSSILWRTEVAETPQDFPDIPWAKEVAEEHEATAGEWYWEFSRNDLHQIHDGEEIRDHMLKAIYGSFANAKQDPKNENYRLQWVSYLLGKRESRRLMGDHIFTFRDVLDDAKPADSVVVEKRDIDLHFQQNLVDETKPDFLSKALFYKTERYYIPYRSLYSRNINNLFMAGRCFSCSHAGLGGPRVMRTTGQMGAAVGMAAALCKQKGVNPRVIYQKYLAEYMDLVENQHLLNFKN
ncbi:MAG: FAD-dependent oxidoreductase [Saprospiraceae bacterium]|nr:FAD-dependent oxidoreductase [Saprospiraceae bacterium]